MDYTEFFQRFGGSCRVKNIPKRPNWKAELASRVRNRDQIIPKPTKGAAYDGRTYIPPKSELPANFIKLDPWEAEYLFILTSRAKIGVVETGRMHGGSTFLLACANREVPIHSIDIEPQNDDRLREILKRQGFGDNVDLIVGDSQRTKYPQIAEIDLLFVDGDHSYEGCTRDLENWYPNLVPGGHVILHDCYYGSPVQPAVIDFIERHEADAVQTPYTLSTHWRHPCGSMTHFIKRS